jgi:hypothetical protein
LQNQQHVSDGKFHSTNLSLITASLSGADKRAAERMAIDPARPRYTAAPAIG